MTPAEIHQMRIAHCGPLTANCDGEEDDDPPELRPKERGLKICFREHNHLTLLDRIAKEEERRKRLAE